MRLQQKALTLGEVLVVVAIVSVLASVGFVMAAPMREAARQTSCASQMGQLYKGLLMYSSDCEASEEFPGVPGISLFALYEYERLMPYLGSKDLLFCPDAPSAVHRHMSSTYTTNLIPTRLFETVPGLAPLYSPQKQLLASRGQLYPMVFCSMHDEFYYQPREADTSNLLSFPYLQELTLGGSVIRRRETSMLRGKLPPDALQ